MKFIPIVPSKSPFPVVKADPVRQLLRNMAREVQNKMMQYPAQRTHIKRKRTGDLGRRWTVKEYTQGGTIIVEIGNNLEYAGYVQGFERGSSKHPQQVRWAAPYGWASVGAVGRDTWLRYAPQIRRALSQR